MTYGDATLVYEIRYPSSTVSQNRTQPVLSFPCWNT